VCQGRLFAAEAPGVVSHIRSDAYGKRADAVYARAEDWRPWQESAEV